MSDQTLLEHSLLEIARVLLRQVKRGGPSNIEQVADLYFSHHDLGVFQELVAGHDPEGREAKTTP